MPPNQPHTPLRRLSQGSLFRLSRSEAYPDAPHGLGFLGPALTELIDEMEALQTNVEGLRSLDNALETFNESFASWLYVMNMNALTTDWPQAPTDASFVLAARRAEKDAEAAIEAIRAAEEAARRPPTPLERTNPTERSAMSPSEGPSEANITTATNKTADSGIVKKKGGKPKMTSKEKRERGLEIERILTALPLEFRGGDPNLRRHVEQVIEKFLDNPTRAFNILAFVKPPDLNQARVNKCLLTLVHRKIVKRDNSTGAVLYHWIGLLP